METEPPSDPNQLTLKLTEPVSVPVVREIEMETERPSDPNQLTLKLTEPVKVVSTTTETEMETERPFDPALATLQLIGAVGDVLANPFSLLVTANDSPAADVNVQAEQEAEIERQRDEQWEVQRVMYRELEKERQVDTIQTVVEAQLEK